MKEAYQYESVDCCNNEQPVQKSNKQPASVLIRHWETALSLILLLLGLSIDYLIQSTWFQDSIRLYWYLLAYLPVALPVWRQALIHLRKGDIFTEFFLMGIATLGAFYIGEYPEGVAVMLFYSLGEAFQQGAVQKARANIKALLDVRPESAHVIRDDSSKTVHPTEVSIGEIIRVKPGERVPLDGKLLNSRNAFDTSALTGESKPRNFRKGESIMAGMINLNQVIELEVINSYENSSICRILQMVQEASSRKAKTELFIRSFARVYTPIVVLLATLLVFLPYYFASPYVFDEWLYRGLVFLVISCPCALVISIPLGYFGGIGASSRNGILFKGSNYLDLMSKVNTIVMDKTGTLTHGVFKVQKVHSNELDTKEFLDIVSAIESYSTHPIARAIVSHHSSNLSAEKVEEISGHGLKGEVNGKSVSVGNGKLLKKFNIDYDSNIDQIVESIVIVAIDNKYAGYITIADEIKSDAAQAIVEMKKNGVKQAIMLSGDKESIVQKVASTLKIDKAFGGLLPEDKVRKVEELQADSNNIIAFVGDGINDAPVLAMSDIGIAMGGMGSDLAIETADVVIQTDQPSKIPTAIKIGKKTKQIVIQNISLAFGVKLIVLILGAGGLATMWEAVFADVGVALLAILNAIRIQQMKF